MAAEVEPGHSAVVQSSGNMVQPTTWDAQLTPATPMPLLPVPAITPAACVPWPWTRRHTRLENAGLFLAFAAQVKILQTGTMPSTGLTNCPTHSLWNSKQGLLTLPTDYDCLCDELVKAACTTQHRQFHAA